ncbi:MAG: hypothetical protein GC182_19200 [Rhodopseudomonas sp.]|nr:hypothetical protein [Rhodopseudomonas sp.]
MPLNDRLSERLIWALACLTCVAILVAPAIWNGFPLLQYDTGGYLTPWFEHKLEINRSVPYGLLLVAGRWADFFPVTIVQSALTVWVLGLTLRAHGLGQRPLLLIGMVAALSVVSTLAFLTAILLTDIFAALSVLALYLLLLRDDSLRRGERIALIVLVAASAATHSGTMAMLLGLVAIATVVWLFDSARIPYTRLLRAMSALLLSTLMVIAANGVVTGKYAWAPGGYALSFGRMLEDGIVKRYLDDHCPDRTLKLCPYKNALPQAADDFFWGDSMFDKLGRFDGMHDEMKRIALDSLVAYPWQQLRSVVEETARQLVSVETGAGVVNWIWNTYGVIEAHVPDAVPAMKAAHQQHGQISFVAINQVQVPVAWLALLLLPAIAFVSLRQTRYADIGELAASITVAILTNAAVFGTLATAHSRYGARVVWLAVFAVGLALVCRYERRTAAAQPAPAACDILPA